MKKIYSSLNLYDSLFRYNITIQNIQKDKKHYIDVDVYYKDFKLANIDGYIIDDVFDDFKKCMIGCEFFIEVLDKYLIDFDFYYCGIYE